MITVTNIQDGNILPHSLALIEGRVESDCKTEVTVTNVTSDCYETHVTRWPVSNHRFTALIHLEKGDNALVLECGTESRRLSLRYSPQSADRFVRLLYVVCKDDPERGRFQGPPESDPARLTAESAMRRIELAARLIQTFTAECLARHGLPRRTFCLETSGGAVVCHLFTLRSVSVVQVRTMSELELWCLVRDELARDPEMSRDVDKCKFVAFLSFTRYRNPSSREAPRGHRGKLELTEGHAALGGGRLALLGTGCLHTWAETVKEVVPRFVDSTKVDTFHLLDDSSYRGTYWACYATTLGAMCHEMGHTFGLKHTDRGIMNRGFDQIHRVFVVTPQGHDQQTEHETEQQFEDCDFSCGTVAPFENPSGLLFLQERLIPAKSFAVSFQTKPLSKPKEKKTPSPPPQPPDVPKKDRALTLEHWHGAFWDKTSAVWLSYHKWFNGMDPRDSGQGPQLHGVEVRSRHGLRVVILEDTNHVLEHWEFLQPSAKLTFRLKPSFSSFFVLDDDQCSSSAMNLTVKAMDSFGNVLEELISKQILLGQI